MVVLFGGGKEERERKERRMRREVEKWWRWTLGRRQTFSADDGGCQALLAVMTRSDQQRYH
eukprot:14221998-Ditylum_brightwellii.AAC.1